VGKALFSLFGRGKGTRQIDEIFTKPTIHRADNSAEKYVQKERRVGDVEQYGAPGGNRPKQKHGYLYDSLHACRAALSLGAVPTAHEPTATPPGNKRGNGNPERQAVQEHFLYKQKHGVILLLFSQITKPVEKLPKLPRCSVHHCAENIRQKGA
jgi:hypothetical protein